MEIWNFHEMIILGLISFEISSENCIPPGFCSIQLEVLVQGAVAECISMMFAPLLMTCMHHWICILCVSPTMGGALIVAVASGSIK